MSGLLFCLLGRSTKPSRRGTLIIRRSRRQRDTTCAKSRIGRQVTRLDLVALIVRFEQ